MINTWSELFAAVKQWMSTPIKWERKAKEEVKDLMRPSPPHGDYPSALDAMFDPELQEKARRRFQEALLEHERSKRRYDDFYKQVNHIPFCAKCNDVGCDECSSWPMNNGDIK